MKKYGRLIGIIAITVIIMSGIVACGDTTGLGDRKITPWMGNINLASFLNETGLDIIDDAEFSRIITGWTVLDEFRTTFIPAIFNPVLFEDGAEGLSEFQDLLTEYQNFWIDFNS